MAEFAVVIGVSPGVGRAVLADALALRHRFPRTWLRILEGEATPWKARQIVQACARLHRAAAEYVDHRVADVVDSISPYRLTKLIQAAKRVADPALAAAEAAEAADRRGVFVTRGNRGDEHGTKTMCIIAPAAGIHRLDARIAQLAQALNVLGDQRPVQHRRADAATFLADPAFALELLTQTHTSQSTQSNQSTQTPTQSTRTPTQSAQTPTDPTAPATATGTQPSSGNDPAVTDPTATSTEIGTETRPSTGAGTETQPSSGNDPTVTDPTATSTEIGTETQPSTGTRAEPGACAEPEPSVRTDSTAGPEANTGADSTEPPAPRAFEPSAHPEPSTRPEPNPGPDSSTGAPSNSGPDSSTDLTSDPGPDSRCGLALTPGPDSRRGPALNLGPDWRGGPASNSEVDSSSGTELSAGPRACSGREPCAMPQLSAGPRLPVDLLEPVDLAEPCGPPDDPWLEATGPYDPDPATDPFDERSTTESVQPDSRTDTDPRAVIGSGRDSNSESGEGSAMDAVALRVLDARLAQIRHDAYANPSYSTHATHCIHCGHCGHSSVAGDGQVCLEGPGSVRGRVLRVRPGQTEVIVHLTDRTLATGTGVVRVEGIGPLLVSQLGELIGHGPYTVKPVIDLNEAVSVNAYEIPPRIRERVRLMHPVELFPYGTRETGDGIDLDHIQPYDPHGPAGQTSTGNLAPLGRFGHRVKTHARGWSVRRIDDKTLEWTTPHGFTFHVDHNGTHRISRADASDDEAGTDTGLAS
ncbi:MAG TPA: hypothetical protein VG497_03930 [Kribbella sp.]|nr:hypothetical protein [Kribbella sp.]